MSSATAGGRARIYGPTNLTDDFFNYEKKVEIGPLLAKIETICRRANLDDDVRRSSSRSGSGCWLGSPATRRSKFKTTATTISSFRAKLDDDDDVHVLQDRHWCLLGLLDPTINIRVNRIIFADDLTAAAAPPPGSNNSKNKGGGGGGNNGPAARRSLDGLVAFLTSLFPYLPSLDATAYLSAADMDPLAAALLVTRARGGCGAPPWRFTYSSAATVEAALRSAAAAAGHPDPRLFVQRWRRVSPGLAELASHLSHLTSSSRSGKRRRCSPADDYAAAAMDRTVARLLARTPPHPDDELDELDLQQAWELATRRLATATATVPVVGGRSGLLLPHPVRRGAMKRMLLATIHGSYLKALGILPKDELTKRLHRSLLRGGYSYGPLDPVANIVVNTAWHEETFDDFPTTSEPLKKEVAMISTSALWRVAARSMYGLVSFLCTRYPRLTPDLALRRLLTAGGSLRAADPNHT